EPRVWTAPWPTMLAESRGEIPKAPRSRGRRDRTAGEEPLDVTLGEAGPREDRAHFTAERRRRRARDETAIPHLHGRAEHGHRPQRRMLEALEHRVRRRLRIVQDLDGERDAARGNAG